MASGCKCGDNCSCGDSCNCLSGNIKEGNSPVNMNNGCDCCDSSCPCDEQLKRWMKPL